MFAKHRPFSTIEFEKQLDYLCQWVEAWDNNERCGVLEALLPRCDQDQVNFLWTVVEPTLHRDFMYSSLNAFPMSAFSPVSTPNSREVHKKLGKPRYRTWKLHRLESVILHDEAEVRAWTAETVLPTVKTPTATIPPVSRQTARSSVAKSCPSPGQWKCQTKYFGIRLPGIAGPPRKSPTRTAAAKSAPPCCSKISPDHAIRRHMQNDLRRYAFVEDEKGCKQNKQQGSWQMIHKSKSCPDFKTSISNKGHHRVITKQSWACTVLQNLPENAVSMVEWFADEWNSWQRNEFLHMFLRVLEPSQLYFLSGLLAVKQYRDFITQLPEQLALKIISYLTPKELLVASQVSKQWRRISSKDELWKSKCSEVYVGVPLSTPTVWKKIFQANLNLKRNWTTGRCHVTDMVGHTRNVLSVCVFKNKIASGSLDRSIKIWDANSGTILQTLQGHARGIWSLRFLSASILISASYDKTIRLWNLRTGICVRILVSHEAPVWAIERKGDILVSGSGDKTAKIWNIRQCKLLYTLFGHTASVFCVDLDDGASRAFTGSADRTVRVWNVQTGCCVSLFNVSHMGDGAAVTAISCTMGHIAVGAGQWVSLWSLETGECMGEFRGHKARIESVQLRFMVVNGRKTGGLIVSAGKDGVVKYWDIDRNECIQSLRGHKDAINCIHFDDTRIISASYDHKVRLWDFNVT